MYITSSQFIGFCQICQPSDASLVPLNTPIPPPNDFVLTFLKVYRFVHEKHFKRSVKI